MARNTLSDLNDHLFAQLERLEDEALSPEEINKEAERAKAINGVAKNIVSNAKLQLEAVRIAYDNLPGDKDLPAAFGVKAIGEK